MPVYNHGSRAPVAFGHKRCAYCGKTFYPKVNNQAYCDLSCKKLNQKRYIKFKRKDTLLRCVICGEKIDSRVKRWLYCSRDCANKAFFYKLVELWIRRTKSQRIKKTVDYIALKEKVERLFYSRKKCVIKMKLKNGTERRQAVNAVLERLFYPKKNKKRSTV